MVLDRLEGTYPNGNVFRRSKEPVNQDTHERGVKAELSGEVSQDGICHTLRHYNGTNGDAYVGLAWVTRIQFSLVMAYRRQDHRTAIEGYTAQSTQ